MVALKSYQSRKFQQLHEFNIARRNLEEGRKHLGRLGQVIINHGVYEHVGVSLLHKHYEIDARERLVKQFFTDKALIRPRMDQSDKGVIPYVWKAIPGKNSEGSGWYPLEFMEDKKSASRAREHLRALNGSNGFLSEMADTLTELQLNDLFGVATLHNDGIMDVDDNETLLETTDVKTRTLTIRKVDRKILEEDKDEITETLWVFSPLKAEGEDDAGCKGHNPCKHCLGHCQTHCKNHCAKHCVNHCKDHPPG